MNNQPKASPSNISGYIDSKVSLLTIALTNPDLENSLCWGDSNLTAEEQEELVIALQDAALRIIDEMFNAELILKAKEDVEAEYEIQVQFGTGIRTVVPTEYRKNASRCAFMTTAPEYKKIKAYTIAYREALIDMHVEALRLSNIFIVESELGEIPF